MEDLYKTTPTVDIIKQLSLLEKELDLKILKYNLLCVEIIKRYPMLADNEYCFKPLVITTEENYVKKLK